MTTADTYRRLSANFEETVRAVGDWDSASPCEGWTARDVLEHVLTSQADAPGKVGLSIDRSIDVAADPIGAWHEVRDAMQSVLDDPAKAGLEYEAFGSLTTLADTVDRFLRFDLIVHRWDIARAVDLPAEIGTEDIDACNALLDEMGPMFYDYGAGKPALPVAGDASDQDKLLARAGRDPHWSPT